MQEREDTKLIEHVDRQAESIKILTKTCYAFLATMKPVFPVMLMDV